MAFSFSQAMGNLGRGFGKQEEGITAANQRRISDLQLQELNRQELARREALNAEPVFSPDITVPANMPPVFEVPVAQAPTAQAPVSPTTPTATAPTRYGQQVGSGLAKLDELRRQEAALFKVLPKTTEGYAPMYSGFTDPEGYGALYSTEAPTYNTNSPEFKRWVEIKSQREFLEKNAKAAPEVAQKIEQLRQAAAAFPQGSPQRNYYEAYAKSLLIGYSPYFSSTATAKQDTARNTAENLFAAVERAESGGNVNAVSPKGAVGPMQLMPKTASNPGFGVTPIRDNSPEENRRVGREYLTAMLNRYNNNLDYALAAYNWGPGEVDKWIAAGADPKMLPKETLAYIPKVKSYLGAMPTEPTQAAEPTIPTQIAGQQPTVQQPVAQAQQPRPQVSQAQITKFTPQTQFYLANPESVGRDLQMLNVAQQRAMRDLQVLRNSGMGAQYLEGLRAVETMNDTKAYLTGMQALNEFETANDPRRLSAVWSAYIGSQVQIQPRTDGLYNVLVNGQMYGQPASRDDISSRARFQFDADFRKSQAAAASTMRMEQFKTGLAMQKELAVANAKAISDIVLQQVKNVGDITKVRVQQEEFEAKVLPDGRISLSNKNGTQVSIIDPNSSTIEIDGQSLPVGPKATRVSGLTTR